MSINGQKYRSLRRKHKQHFLMNDHEIDAFEKYCKKYKISNRSKIIREALFSKVIQSLEDDSPTLFGKDELARLEKKEY